MRHIDTCFYTEVAFGWNGSRIQLPCCPRRLLQRYHRTSSTLSVFKLESDGPWFTQTNRENDAPGGFSQGSSVESVERGSMTSSSGIQSQRPKMLRSRLRVPMPLAGVGTGHRLGTPCVAVNGARGSRERDAFAWDGSYAGLGVMAAEGNRIENRVATVSS